MKEKELCECCGLVGCEKHNQFKKEKEFDLRKAREELFEIILRQNPTPGRIFRIIRQQDKELIKRLKECDWVMQTQIDDINRLAGELR